MTPSPLRPGDSHHEQDVAQRALYGASWDRAQSVGRRKATPRRARPVPALLQAIQGHQRNDLHTFGMDVAGMPPCRPAVLMTFTAMPCSKPTRRTT